MSLIFFVFGASVKLRVVSQKINFESGITFSPEYEIISGKFSGVKSVSKIGTTFGTHRVNANLKGLYLPTFGWAESVVSLRLTTILGLGLFIAGLIIHF